MYYTVYRTTNLVNGKFYIGCHKTKNLDDGYIGSGKLLKKAVKKYGRENFESSIIRIFKSEKAMFNYEKKLIAKHKSDPNCYNIADGGWGGWNHINSNSSLKERSLAAAGEAIKRRVENDPAFKAQLADNLSKLNKSKAMREARKKQMKGVSYWRGRAHTEEAKKKIGQANSLIHKGRSTNRCWISHDKLEQSRSIRTDELDSFLKEGWRKGRVMTYGRADS